MRALVDDPDLISASDYRQFVRTAQIEGMMADHLVEGEPYLALNAVVLQDHEAELLQRLSATFASAFARAGRIVQQDVATLVEMGFPWVCAELLAAEPATMPLVGRFDFVQRADGRWWLLEYNADTPSGLRETVVVDRLAHDHLTGLHAVRRPSAAFGSALAEAFLYALTDLEPGRALGLLTSAGELEDLLQLTFVGRLLREPLAERGIHVVVADLDNVTAPKGRLALCGRPVDALYRCAPFETMLGTSTFAAIAEATATGRLRLLNGMFGLLLQHKGLLAWLWEHRDDPRFPPDERAAIQAHLPPTWWIAGYPAGLSRTELVAKQVFGREGEEVFFGADVDAETWDVLRRRRSYVAQQHVDVVGFSAVVPTACGLIEQRGHATIGCFNVRGRGVGFYTRFGGAIINARAKWLATFVDSERGVDNHAALGIG